MKFRVSILAVLVSIALCGGSAEALAFGAFSFQVCNKTDAPASVAVYYYDLAIPVWHAQGWWVVSPSQCTVIGDFSKGAFFYYAKSETRGWEGSDDSNKICVSSSQFYNTYGLGSNPTCSSDEKKAFIRNDINDDASWTLD
jgi:uncharacterized membrane protein